MKSNRDLLQGLTILNTVLLLTFTDYLNKVCPVTPCVQSTQGLTSHIVRACPVTGPTCLHCARISFPTLTPIQKVSSVQPMIRNTSPLINLNSKTNK
uniref:RxLR effector candidate protein n=1 Tax=Hyaloperonospora arabidopsidis (strain Emoy2) TaxID=559515 RepID=M4BBC7_HYAAE